ncbi:hypothetical protein QBC40DRAFT_305206 [Triangularia verruculosa]|uniref:Uncharacterized protein n=1 Tax=Triangularia verruculosa TaxID=2587418 RepID=A0AAN6XNC4_9PEZI|nr:hypothetical protein QBC40DRAFT_305206 [Triangularia verruculosa]
MLSSLLIGLSAACLAAASPVITDSPKNLLKRHHQTTTVTVTTWASAVTVTQNPSDPTITRPAFITRTVGTPTFTSTITRACLSYSFLYPPEGHGPNTQTYTYQTRSTITIFDAAKRTTTRTVEVIPTVTVTKPTNTVIYYHCPNTLVVSFVDHESLTWSWTQYAAGITHVTVSCLTSSTRSTTIPGITLPTTTKTLADWEYLHDGLTIATKYSVAVLYEAFPTMTELFTSTVCNAGQTVDWTTTVRVTPRQTTRTVTEEGPGCTQSEAGGLERRQGTPVRVETVVYTTVTVVDNTPMTLTGTAVVDVHTAVFTRTRVKYETVTATGEGGIVTVTACGRAE